MDKAYILGEIKRTAAERKPGFFARGLRRTARFIGALACLIAGAMTISPYGAVVSAAQQDVLCVPLTSADGRPAGFLSRLLESLRAAQRGFLAYSAAAAAVQQATPASQAEAVYQYRYVAATYDCAATLLAPFANSTNVNIKQAATMGVATFRTEAELDRAVLELYKKLLEQRSMPLSDAAFADTMAAMRLRSGKVTDAFIRVVPGAAIDALVVFDSSTQRASGLALTRPQRDSALRSLRQDFGKVVVTPSDTMTWLEGAARTLYRSLSAPRWRLQPAH
jgi:hypothetical protein